MSMRYIAVTMNRESYQFLLHGKSGTGGCKDKDGVIAYLNRCGGFLGEVIDVKVEG